MTDTTAQKVTDRQRKYMDALYTSLAAVVKAIGVDFDEFMAHLSSAYQKTVIPEPRDPTDSEDKHFLPSLLAYWHSSPDFTDDKAEPLALTLTGNTVSLDRLVKDVLTSEGIVDSHYQVQNIANSLVQSGSVQLEKDGRLRAIHRFFPYLGGGSFVAESVLRATSEYLETTARNVLRQPNGIGSYQRTARSTSFPRNRLKVLRAILDDEGMEFLTRIDTYISEDTDETDTGRVSVGLYMYSDDKSV